MEQNLLDLDKLLERMEDDRELIREIFDVFVEEVPSRRGKFEKALAASDASTMVLLAHSLKGASGTLHAEPLRQACYELEHAARAGDLEKVQSLTPEVLDLLERTSLRMVELRAEV